MYEIPIEIIYGQMNEQIENGVLKVVQNYGVHVDKEELIKALKYDREQYKKGYYDAKLEEQRRIPVSEKRLPDDGEDVLVTYVDGEEIRVIPANYDMGIWFDNIFNIALDPLKITAWQPVPEAYKAESE